MVDDDEALEHVRISNTHDGAYLMSCDYCGRKANTRIQPPMSLDMALVMMEQYEREHAHCDKTAVYDEE